MITLKFDPDALPNVQTVLKLGLRVAVDNGRVDSYEASVAGAVLLTALAADPSFADELETALGKDNAGVAKTALTELTDITDRHAQPVDLPRRVA